MASLNQLYISNNLFYMFIVKMTLQHTNNNQKLFFYDDDSFHLVNSK